MRRAGPSFTRVRRPRRPRGRRPRGVPVVAPAAAVELSRSTSTSAELGAGGPRRGRRGDRDRYASGDPSKALAAGVWPSRRSLAAVLGSANAPSLAPADPEELSDGDDEVEPLASAAGGTCGPAGGNGIDGAGDAGLAGRGGDGLGRGGVGDDVVTRGLVTVVVETGNVIVVVPEIGPGRVVTVVLVPGCVVVPG